MSAVLNAKLQTVLKARKAKIISMFQEETLVTKKKMPHSRNLFISCVHEYSGTNLGRWHLQVFTSKITHK